MCAALLSMASPALAQNAADAYYDPAVMAAARTALKSSHGAQINSLLLGERFEFLSNDGEPLAVWEGQGWIGGDAQKLWLKTEGEYDVDGGRLEEAELQALYSRAVSAFWDLQVGLRHDVRPTPSRTYLAMGVQGLARYWFEFDAQLFLSEAGNLSARLEAEYDFLLTQRLILQPRIEVNASFSADEEIAVGSGLSTTDVEVRLRYEIKREAAPYIGVSWSRAFGDTADAIRTNGKDSDQLSWVAGFRFWF